jgi:hypothetical protein
VVARDEASLYRIKERSYYFCRVRAAVSMLRHGTTSFAERFCCMQQAPVEAITWIFI